MIWVRQVNGACLVIAALFILLLWVPLESHAAGGRTYRVHGQVMAVNISQSTQMIDVKTTLSKHNDMTVGAKVSAHTRITRKGKRISLQHVNVGEGVWLTYIKQRDGVFARIIQVQ